MIYLCPLCRWPVETTIDGWACSTHGALKRALVESGTSGGTRPVEMGTAPFSESGV